MCFVVFCGCFVMFCGCFAVFCECFAVLQYFHKTPEKHRKTKKHWNKKLTIRSCIAGIFQEPKNSTVLHKTPFTKTAAKHCKTPQNSHKTRFVKLRRKTHTAKRTQNAQKRHKTLTHNTAAIRIRIAIVLRALHSVFSPKIR